MQYLALITLASIIESISYQIHQASCCEFYYTRKHMNHVQVRGRSRGNCIAKINFF